MSVIETANSTPGTRANDHSADILDASVRIRVCNVGKTFTLHNQGGVQLPAFAHANFVVHSGESLALTGRSGAGKSTLLRCLYGNYQPSIGSVQIRHNDELVDLVTADPHLVIEIRKHTVGWVSQFLRVIPRIPTRTIVSEPLVSRGYSFIDADERAVVLLRKLNIPERLWSLAPATFSGGEQQRVNVARGLAGAHPVLLVDEPTASLDPQNRDVVVALLNEARSNGTAIVGIFHDDDTRRQVASHTLDVSILSPHHESFLQDSHPLEFGHD
jgi:alpha-D-ribose 1-methylphosphonate 5-triphosphate synthase subunit PhnL